MSRNEIGLREARQQLGDLVTAAQYGTTTVITRNGRPAAMLVPYTPEESAVTAEPTKYIAAIATASDVVEGDFCDVSVITSEVIGYRDNAEGESIPEYGMTDTVVMPAQELTVRTDDDDKLGKIQEEAERILGENGWKVVGTWHLADNAAYADVELV